jgi:hypothetical protein
MIPDQYHHLHSKRLEFTQARFYLEYPRIVQTLSARTGNKIDLLLSPIHQTLSDESTVKSSI